jgi:hypothetical protein
MQRSPHSIQRSMDLHTEKMVGEVDDDKARFS